MAKPQVGSVQEVNVSKGTGTILCGTRHYEFGPKALYQVNWRRQPKTGSGGIRFSNHLKFCVLKPGDRVFFVLQTGHNTVAKLGLLPDPNRRPVPRAERRPIRHFSHSGYCGRRAG